MKRGNQNCISAKKLIGVRIKRKDQKYTNNSKLIKIRIKKRAQKYISARKLMGMRIKKNKTRLIIIVTDIFPLFFQNYQMSSQTEIRK